MNLDQLIEQLRNRNDARLYFWIKLQDHLRERNFYDALEMIQGNVGDSDYDDQVMIVAKEIASM